MASCRTWPHARPHFGLGLGVRYGTLVLDSTRAASVRTGGWCSAGGGTKRRVQPAGRLPECVVRLWRENTDATRRRVRFRRLQFTLGVDYRLGTNLVVGGIFGFSEQVVDFDERQAQSASSMVSRLLRRQLHGLRDASRGAAATSTGRSARSPSAMTCRAISSIRRSTSTRAACIRSPIVRRRPTSRRSRSESVTR